MDTRKTFGYARVSARDQNEDRQIQSLLRAGIPERDIFLDKETGAHFDRQSYQALLSRLRPGDTLVLPSLDRLGRHYSAIQEEWRRLTQEMGVSIQVQDMPILQSGTPGTLDHQFIADLVLQILSYVAQKERENMKYRQRQGIEAARLRGKHLGRPRLAIPDDFDEVVCAWRRGEYSAKRAMEKLGIKRTRFYALVKAHDSKTSLYSPICRDET